VFPLREEAAAARQVRLSRAQLGALQSSDGFEIVWMFADDFRVLRHGQVEVPQLIGLLGLLERPAGRGAATQRQRAGEGENDNERTTHGLHRRTSASLGILKTNWLSDNPTFSRRFMNSKVWMPPWGSVDVSPWRA